MLHLIYSALILSASFNRVSSSSSDETDWSTAAWIAGGAVAALVAAPVAVAAAGFTGAGIAAGSFGAQMMSAAALANGGGVAAGGIVATLQSLGAAGISTAGAAVIGSVGGLGGYVAKAVFQGSEDEP
ncbi:interferon alpha-inducible protein 27-like protein 2A isoform X1 [Chiloscyllium plagiosum]|uniref:interferon alpha-inducible protein 27-like protein 2A isoform X1 n=1 Tax=Chiloscyllium plagiosum TaxID=36176 RepID=UPI001CB88808|nr:interferon alpha-inducible protein 27-like protein 2A isoform X1 [Chiloscyllium plagiosum]